MAFPTNPMCNKMLPQWQQNNMPPTDNSSMGIALKHFADNQVISGLHLLDYPMDGRMDGQTDG